MLESTVREGFLADVTFKGDLQGERRVERRGVRLGKECVPRPWGRTLLEAHNLHTCLFA